MGKRNKRNSVDSLSISDEVQEKLKEMKISISARVVEMIIKLSEDSDRDHLLEGDELIKSYGTLFLKKRGTNQKVHENEGSTVKLAGNIDYSLKQRARDRMKNDSDYEELLK